jgi:DNA-binding response OmpR family regulator
MNIPAKDQPPKRVLLVEDDSDLLDVSKAMLESGGFSVIPAEDGETAIKLLQRDKFDLVVLDIILPKLDGFSVFKSLRSASSTRNLPVLVVSGRSGMSDTFLSCGADGFLAKPVEKQDLVSAAKDLTRNKALLMTDSPHVTEKISRIFDKHGYDTKTVKDEAEMVRAGKSKKYKCVIAHLAHIISSPEKFKETVESLLSYKEPTLIVYSDSSVKGLETSSTVAIEDEMTKWTRAGVKNFYDPRIIRRPLNLTLQEWLP